MKTILKPFGRYFLLDRIARGGMAEIYRARYAMPDSGARLMVIKCMTAELSGDANLRQMFAAEVKILLGMNHPNIVHFYDFGDGSDAELEGTPRSYIAMEYLPGQSLRQFVSATRKAPGRKGPASFPIPFALHVITQACQALHYAHEFTDPLTAAPQHIIHRDVNPQNILVLYDGSVKLIDFGIAKSAKSETTQTGLIKGTPAYLSPEQIRLQRLDRRCDVFSLGVVLWEMLAGCRLFRAEDDRATLLRIASSDKHVIPPSTHNPEVGAALDRVVLKALAHDTDNRYSTTVELERDLRSAFKESTGNALSAGLQAEIGAHIRTVFSEAIRNEQVSLRELNRQAEAMILEKFPAMVSTANEETDPAGTVQRAPEFPQRPVAVRSADSRSDEINLTSGGFSAELRIDLPKESPSPGFTRGADSPRYSPPRPPNPPGRGFRLSRSLGRVAALLGVLAIGYAYQSRISELPTAMKSQVLRVFADTERNRAQTATQVRSPTSESASAERISERIHLRVVPPGSDTRISLNGADLPVEGSSSSASSADVGDGQSGFLYVSRPGYVQWSGRFDPGLAQRDSSGRLVLTVRLVPMRFGLLSVKTQTSAEVTIRIDGVPWTIAAPFEGEKLPVGKYVITVMNHIRNLRRDFEVSIEEGKIRELRE